MAWTRYAYDRVGNRTRLERPNQVISYQYDGAHQLLQAGTLAFTYDAAGNRTSVLTAGGLITYRYDQENRLTEVRFPDGTWVSYAYDGYGRLVRREESYWQNRNHQRTEVTHYLYDGLQVLMEYAGSSGAGVSPLAEYYQAGDLPIARRMYGYHGRKEPGHEEQIRTRGGLLYYHTDALGNVTALTDRHGQPVMRYAYDAFGEPLAGIYDPYNLYGLTGKRLDEVTGLYYFGARWYDPRVGQWLTADPFRGTLLHPPSLQRYQYVWNNPLRFVDPWGYMPEWLVESNRHARAWLEEQLASGEVTRDELTDLEYEMLYGNARTDWLTVGVFFGGTGVATRFGANAVVAGAVRAWDWVKSRVTGSTRELSATPVVESSTAAARRLGRAGEEAAGIVRNTERIVSLTNTARFRVPDILDHARGIIGEVKNRRYVPYTRQLRDYVAYARLNQYEFQLWIRRGTVLSRELRQLRDTGQITIRYLEGLP